MRTECQMETADHIPVQTSIHARSRSHYVHSTSGHPTPTMLTSNADMPGIAIQKEEKSHLVIVCTAPPPARLSTYSFYSLFCGGNGNVKPGGNIGIPFIVGKGNGMLGITGLLPLEPGRSFSLRRLSKRSFFRSGTPVRDDCGPCLPP